MKFLTQAQLSMLVDLEDEYGCNFYLPPLHTKLDCCFFDIHKIKDHPIKFLKFMDKLAEIDVSHKYIDINGKKYMAVMA